MKTRIDAWEEKLPEDVRWELYSLAKPPSAEEIAAGRKWLRDYRDDVLPYLSLQGIAAPSRAGWYRFLGRMRCAERVRLVAQVASSGQTAGDMARETIDDATAAEAYKGLSVDAAMSGDAKTAALYAQAASAFRDRAQKAEELRLKAAAQQTKDDALRLAREKFEAAEKRLERVAEIADAARGGKVDPAKVADEIDRILGRKK